MKRLRPFLALLLALLWLPAVLHCALEAVDVGLPGQACCEHEAAAAPADDCTDDACPAIEDAFFKETSQVIKVAAPEACAADSHFVLAPDAAPDAAPARLSPTPAPPPRELAAAWQFSVRAAPPAQAP